MSRKNRNRTSILNLNDEVQLTFSGGVYSCTPSKLDMYSDVFMPLARLMLPEQSLQLFQLQDIDPFEVIAGEGDV